MDDVMCLTNAVRHAFVDGVCVNLLVGKTGSDA